MDEEEEISGPWRATKLWNTIVRNFRSGMPLKKHKKNMRTYENCFSSTEAVDWLHKNLQKNPNFGADVTKEQTTLLLKKLFRAGIIENVREEANDEEFKVSGELYRFSTKSPVRNLRTPGKVERKPLADTGNTPRTSLTRDKTKDTSTEKPERERSTNRKLKDEMKKQLNLSYFQALPSNSLIILDNDDIWRRVFMEQLSKVLSKLHTERLDYAGQLDMENIMHNMTRVSAKGIVQVEDRAEDLPHWVLSAMKCLANWPKQLKTVNGKESCLPSYAGFEHDVFNVVKDYFQGLPGPLTTFPLYEFFVEAFIKAESSDDGAVTLPVPRLQTVPNCRVHPGSASRPCSRPFTQTNPDLGAQANDFYTMTDQREDFSILSNQERVARIRQTFQVLPPLATSSAHNSNNTNSTLASSGHSTFDTTSPSLSPDMSTTAIMKQFLPPNTCFETAFVEESPITRIVPQREHEVLHIKRSWSGRSLSQVTSVDWATRNSSTQTDVRDQDSGSLKRIPKWKRTSRFRKSIAVMESHDRRKPLLSLGGGSTAAGGIVNGGFSAPPDPELGEQRRPRQLVSTGDLPAPVNKPIRGYSSVDNLLDRETKFEQEFMMKYRQVSGDLIGSCDLVELAKERFEDGRDRNLIESKAVRKEKKKRRFRNSSTDRLGYDTDNEVRYEPHSRYESRSRHCYVNRGMEQSPELRPAPLAAQEITDLSPVPFNRNAKYNNSYRLANNQPATPSLRSNLPRTSTRLDLQPGPLNNNPSNKYHHVESEVAQECLYVRAEPYNCLNSDVSSSVVTDRLGRDSLYTRVGQGPIQRYSVHQSSRTLPNTNRQFPNTHRQDSTTHRQEGFRRDSAARTSRSSQATQDSGRYSDWSRTSHYVNRVPVPAHSSGSEHGHYARFPRTVPHRVLAEKLQVLARKSPEEVDECAVNIFKLLTLLLPPANRRKLQLLIKFIRKVALNYDLSLDDRLSNRDLSLNTFSDVILRPGDIYTSNLQVNRRILNLFLDKYDEIWTPPQSLRKEVEEKVYQSLVNRRMQAGEDPYPVTYCRQVTKAEYENSKLSGAETALLDLLQAILVDKKMNDKEKTKKLKKFKESYPNIWRRKFPTENSEPELGASKLSKFSSLSRIKSAMGM